jgi:hypothetical protein
MKTNALFSCAVAVAALAAAPPMPIHAADVPAGTPVRFSLVSSRYFVKNYVPRRARSFFAIRDFATFDSIFGYGAVMSRDPLPAVTAKNFATRTFFVAIASGPVCSLAPTSVTVRGDRYQVAYVSKCEAPGSATYSVPLILSVPRAQLGSVTFVENGRVAGTVATFAKPVPSPATPPAH